MKRVLIDAATVTDATKQEFTLGQDDFHAKPMLRSTGLLVNDVVTVWHKVNNIWQDTGIVLNNTTTWAVLESEGVYAVSLVIALVSTVSVEIGTSGIGKWMVRASLSGEEAVLAAESLVDDGRL